MSHFQYNILTKAKIPQVIHTLTLGQGKFDLYNIMQILSSQTQDVFHDLS